MKCEMSPCHQAAPTLVRAKHDTQHSSGVLAELARADAVPTEARASHRLLTHVPRKEVANRV
jgi:hypothetical protein